MTRLMFKKHAAEFFAREFSGFQWVGFAASGPDFCIHRFEDAKMGQRMLIEVFDDNSWAAYMFHANGEEKS